MSGRNLVGLLKGVILLLFLVSTSLKTLYLWVLGDVFEHALCLIALVTRHLFEMKSYIKIFGPPVFKTIKELEKIAVEMPDVCIMSLPIEASIGKEGVGIYTRGGMFEDYSNMTSYFGSEIPEERCNNIISKSGERLGRYDFYFEWFKNPSMENINLLIEKIDEAVEKTGAKYTITTK
jgi:hypothetical protein